MIHKYTYNNTNIVLDVNSGSIHILDDLSYTVLDYIEYGRDEAVNKLKDKYNVIEINECIDEILELKAQGRLLSAPINIDYERKPVVKALCLHVAHDCNLKCKYCFAGEGEYHGERSLMSAETGIAAINFITENSGNRKNLEIDFFGGEPTINFNVVKQIVEYAKTKKHKNFRFTLTTNAFSISDEMIDFCNDNVYNVVLSIDGRKEVNDAMRPDRNRNGSYEKIVNNINRFLDKRGHEKYYVRGTFTKHNLDFSKDVTHLADLGFKQISIEPVVADRKALYGLTEDHLQTLYKEYDKLVDIMLKRNDFNFFHFNIDLTGGSCVYKRISGCGAGCEYMSVTPEGDLYPCHQFTGLNDFKMGTVYDGVLNTGLSENFSNVNIFTKVECADCWAKFYCSGGCSANAYLFGGDIAANYELGCNLHRKRIECAIYLQLIKNGFLAIDA